VGGGVVTDDPLWRRWDAGGWTRLSSVGQLLVARGLGDVKASIKVGPDRLA
jgi:beta-glucosidase